MERNENEDEFAEFKFTPEQIAAAINESNDKMIILLADLDFVWLFRFELEKGAWEL